MNIDLTRESEIIQSNLEQVRDKLERKRSTLDSLLMVDGKPIKNISYYIHVENRPVKKDRQAYMAALEKEKLKARRRVEQQSIKCNANAITAFSGAPFDTQEERFKNKGVHPNYTDVLVRRQNPGVAPGSYDIAGGDHSMARNVHQSDYWKLPYINRDMILNERQRKEKLKLKQREEKRGPGMYNTDDIPKHVGHSVKDSTFNRDRRFRSDMRIDDIKRGHLRSNLHNDILTVPGPGTYGIPDRKACDPRDGKEMFKSSGGHTRIKLLTGSGLAPGVHHTANGDIQERIKTTGVGKRGPYEGLTTDRWAPINQGTSYALRLLGLTVNDSAPHLGPGTYDPKHPDKEKKEEFHHDTAEQQMNKRNMTTSSYTQISRKKHQRNIGPGSYETRSFSDKYEKEWRRVSQIGAEQSQQFTAKRWAQAEKYNENYGFLSTSKRHDKITDSNWTKGMDSKAGPGRYNVERFEAKTRHQGIASGHRSVFKSKQPQFKQFKAVDPQEKIREQYKATFQRNKERLEKLISQGSRSNKRLRRLSYFPRK